ncbi:DUF445 domain-containing protein [Niabella terrae]
MNFGSDQIKERQLKKHKRVATGLFLLMVLLYIGTTWLLRTHPMIGLQYVKAFAEAAMVGALADWFAVTALFHHPLGIPIPHTNLIENRKKSIGANLGGFVVNNFLNARTIKPYILKLDTSRLLIQWLQQDKNKSLLLTEISRLLRDLISRTDEQLISGFIARKSAQWLQELRLTDAVASGMELVIQRGDQVRILDYLVGKLKVYVTDHEALVRERVKKESHFLIPGFVDNLIASKIVSGLTRYLSEIEQDPQHVIRKDIDRQLHLLVDQLRTSSKWEAQFQEIKNALLDEARLKRYAGAIWKQLQTAIISDLSDTHSMIRKYLEQTLTEMGSNLEENPDLQEKINRWVRLNAYRYLLRNTEKAGELISNTVGNWEGRQLSTKLELEVGKDLQFIRINGTLVGGLVGLLIYTITRLIETI